jgi:unsaturated rhamnogalacturonyl hydrolase
VCVGSKYAFTADYYKNDLPWKTNDTHGIGIVLLAGIEVERLNVYMASEDAVESSKYPQLRMEGSV